MDNYIRTYQNVMSNKKCDYFVEKFEAHTELHEVQNNNHEAYTIIFLFYASALFLGLILYLKSKDRLD